MKKYKTPIMKPVELKTAGIIAGSPFNTTGNEGGIQNFSEGSDVEFE